MTISSTSFFVRLAKGLATQFGPHCEIVLYEKTKEDTFSIRYIENGNVSGRVIGDKPLKRTIELLEEIKKTPKDLLAYLCRTEYGRILKCSSIFIYDETEEVQYLLSINYDISNLLALEKEISDFTTFNVKEQKSTSTVMQRKKVKLNVNTLLDELIDQSVKLVGVPIPLMDKQDKIKAINYLNDSGAFLITKAGDKIAKHFGISKYTLYSYAEINK